jgi:hypothetical protein
VQVKNGGESSEVESVEMDHKEVLKIKYTAAAMTNASKELINWYMQPDEERMSEHKYVFKVCQLDKKISRNFGKNRIWKNCWGITKKIHNGNRAGGGRAGGVTQG